MWRFESDMACEMAGAYALEKGIDLVRFAAGDQFHTAVGQVFDRSRDIIFAGQIFDGVAEADTLHAAFVVDAEGFHGRRQALTTEDTEGTKKGVFILLAEFVFGLAAMLRALPMF